MAGSGWVSVHWQRPSDTGVRIPHDDANGPFAAATTASLVAWSNSMMAVQIPPMTFVTSLQTTVR